MSSLSKTCSGAAAALLFCAAGPSALAGVAGGLWEISREGVAPVRLCVANPASFAQFQERNSACTRNVIRDSGTDLTINFSCSGGGFGQSTITVLTPRSLRVQTQGISDNSPFNYVFQARRAGNCPGH